MNRDVFEKSWKQVEDYFRNRWAKLTTHDVEVARGTFDGLVSAVQRRYGMAKDVAEKELDAFIAAIDPSRLKNGKSDVAVNIPSNKTPSGDTPPRTN